MPIDYATLRFVWWLLMGVLLAGFAIFDGFDLGVAVLLPWIAKDDLERRVVINSVGPVWEGNQVWFILAGGALFAAWPMIYAVTFSAFYLAMFLLLIGFILRPVGFKYRSKMPNKQWRKNFDIIIFLGGFIPSLLFGVAIGNVLQGIPFNFDETLRVFYTGNFFQLLNPFALLCGAVSLTMLTMHGAFYLATKTTHTLQMRAQSAARTAAALLILLFVGAGFWIGIGIKGYSVVGDISHFGPSNPLYKSVITSVGAWLNNYSQMPGLKFVPALAIFAAILATFFSIMQRNKLAFVASAVVQTFIIGTLGVSMFPFILPSSSSPQSSLLVWDASSSQLTLFVMLIAVLFFMPIILAYTAWVYRILKGPISKAFIKDNDESVY